LGWVGAALARTLGYIATVPTVCVGMYYTETETQFVIDVYNGMIYKEAVTKEHIITFLHLGIPGMIQMMRKSFLLNIYPQLLSELLRY
jgi:Na+-driven multidrug efflux pump